MCEAVFFRSYFESSNLLEHVFLEGYFNGTVELHRGVWQISNGRFPAFMFVCPGEMFSAESVKPRDLDRAPQRWKKTLIRHKSSKKSQ